MFRETILRELDRQGLSHYAIVERLSDKIPRRTLYGYLAGRQDMAGEKVGILCQALGLTLKRSNKSRK